MHFFYISILGEWQVKEVKPSIVGEAQEVKVKVRINHNGIALVASAQMIEKKEAHEAESNGEMAEQQASVPSSSDAQKDQDSVTAPAEPMDTASVEVKYFICLKNLKPKNTIH
jgi:molecular chaperone DnaK (HSP70)